MVITFRVLLNRERGHVRSIVDVHGNDSDAVFILEPTFKVAPTVLARVSITQGTLTGTDKHNAFHSLTTHEVIPQEATTVYLHVVIPTS